MLPGPLAQVRREERRNALVAFAAFFAVLASHVMTETARDALFLAELSAAELPWVYLGIAAIAVVVATRALTASRKAMAATLWVAAAADVLLWFVVDQSRPWSYFVLYIWSGLFGAVAITQLWLLMGQFFTIADAKKLYGFIGSGGVLGALAGAGSAAAFAELGPAEDILLGSAALLAVGGLTPLLLRAPDGDDASVRPFRSSASECWQTIRSHPYIRRLFVFVIVGTAALTVTDWLFKAQVEIDVPRDELASFFAIFYAALNAVAVVAQIALTGWLLRRIGVHRALWVLPTVIALGSVALAIGGGLFAAMALKTADGSLKHSLNRTVTEVLYLPIPERLRRHSKAFIDVMGQRGAQALASLAILGAVGLGVGHALLAALAAGLAVTWLLIAVSLKRHYLDIFRASLREGAIQTRVDAPELDLGALEALIKALNSDDDSEVLSAMDLLAYEDKTELIPALILHHPAEDIVVRALDLFTQARRDDFLRLADRLIEDRRSPRVSAAALRARNAIAPNRPLLARAANSDDPLVRATAIVGQVALREVAPEAANAALLTLITGASTTTQMAVVQAITEQPEACLCTVLITLAESPDHEVRRATAAAMGRHAHDVLIPSLIAMLGARRVRLEAREALVQIGAPALAALRDAMLDPATPADVRLHLPRTISRFPAQAAADILLTRFEDEPSAAVRYKILRGLGRLRADHPALRLDDAVLKRASDRLIRHILQLMAWQTDLIQQGLADDARQTPGHELLARLLADKIKHATERLFRVLGLDIRDEDIAGIYDALAHGTRKARANALELLEYRLGPERRDAVLAIADLDGDPEARLARASSFHTRDRLAYNDVVRALLTAPSRSLRAFAAYHAGELSLRELRPALEALERSADKPYVARVVERALTLFRGPSAPAP